AGAIATATYASIRHWTIVIPASAWAGGLAAAVLIGAVAGLLPAVRAARMPPQRSAPHGLDSSGRRSLALVGRRALRARPRRHLLQRLQAADRRHADAAAPPGGACVALCPAAVAAARR